MKEILESVDKEYTGFKPGKLVTLIGRTDTGDYRRVLGFSQVMMSKAIIEGIPVVKINTEGEI